MATGVPLESHPLPGPLPPSGRRKKNSRRSSRLERDSHASRQGLYPSAKDFSEQVRKTFVEEGGTWYGGRPLPPGGSSPKMWLHRWGTLPSFAAIDEGDKIRTIYDGSWGRANAHIQQNTAEKTTAPTVMDCIEAIRYSLAEYGQGGPHPSSSHGHWHGVGTFSEDHYVGDTQSWCHEGPPENQDCQGWLALPGGTAGRRMVGKQGGNLWHGKCPTILGQDGSSSAQTLLLNFPAHWLGVCLCWWFLLAFEDWDGNPGHSSAASASRSSWLPP